LGRDIKLEVLLNNLCVIFWLKNVCKLNERKSYACIQQAFFFQRKFIFKFIYIYWARLAFLNKIFYINNVIIFSKISYVKITWVTYRFWVTVCFLLVCHLFMYLASGFIFFCLHERRNRMYFRFLCALFYEFSFYVVIRYSLYFKILLVSIFQ